MADRPRRILVCIVGVGAGNTTRNLAILHELQKLGPCDIRLCAQGRARELLEPHFRTYALETVSYTKGDKFGAIEILKNNLNFPARLRRNMRAITKVLEEFQPDLVVADSDFYCLRPAKKLGFRLASINNSPWTVEGIRSFGGVPKNCRVSYQFIEKTDYWLQRRYPDNVLCPVIRPIKNLPDKYHQLPAFVRPDVQPLAAPGEEVVVITGGSGIDTRGIDLRALAGNKIRVLGTTLHLVPRGTQQVGFTLDVAEHLRNARLLIIQGGFSSISEAVALQIPTVVLPIKNHAEQWFNARTITDLGLGLMARETSQAGALGRRILKEYDQFWSNARKVTLPRDGHKRAAKLIWKWAGEEQG